MPSDTDIPPSPLDQALLLRDLLLSVAQRRGCDNAIYMQLRTNLMNTPSIPRALIPSYVRLSSNEGQLWDHLQKVHSGEGAQEARQDYIKETLQPLIDRLEATHSVIAEDVMMEELSSLSRDRVRQAWDKALELQDDNPRLAITAALMLLETVCKHILDEAGEKYRSSDQLPKLFVRTSWVLSFAPLPEAEDEFRTVLGNYQTALLSLNMLLEDSGPTPWHAALAVNLAGSMATFFMEAWLAKLRRRPPNT